MTFEINRRKKDSEKKLPLSSWFESRVRKFLSRGSSVEEQEPREVQPEQCHAARASQSQTQWTCAVEKAKVSSLGLSVTGIFHLTDDFRVVVLVVLVQMKS